MTKHEEIDFNVTITERWLIREIVKRAVKLAGGPRKCDQLALTMDITAVHCNGNALRLEEMLRADDFNFLHDIVGIRECLNRTTGKFERNFSPRFTSAVTRAKVRKRKPLSERLKATS